MNRGEKLITIISEEAGEVIQEASKSLRFGMDGYHPDDKTKTPNYMRLLKEFYELQAAIEYAQDEHLLPKLPIETIKSIMSDKRRRIDKWGL